MTRSKALFGSGLLAAWAALASPAIAGDVASEFGLGTVRGFDDEEAARTHCQGDGVVWVDRKTGFYYPKFAPEDGAGRTGSFACFKDAKKADYWGLGGGSDAMAGSGAAAFSRFTRNRNATTGSTRRRGRASAPNPVPENTHDPTSRQVSRARYPLAGPLNPHWREATAIP